MNTSTKYLILLAIFVVMTVISAATVYSALQRPESQTTKSVSGTYISTAGYDCIANLNQSIIYNNLTRIRPSEATLYTRLVKGFDISLTYQFNSTFQIPTTIEYTLTQTLRTKTWEYQLPTDRISGNTDQKTIVIKIPPISTEDLESTVNRINKETGSFDNLYTLDITPTFRITGVSSLGNIDETFEPILRVSTNNTRQGYVTTVDGQTQYQSGEFMKTQLTTDPGVPTQRNISYILATLSLIGMAISSVLYLKNRSTTPRVEVDKQIESHKDIIVDATYWGESPKIPKVVNLKTMDELVKASEILAKPIIHTMDGEQRNLFYVVDNTTMYQYNESTD